MATKTVRRTQSATNEAQQIGAGAQTSLDAQTRGTRGAFDDHFVMMGPHVTLYADASDDSLEAFDALAAHDIRFAVKPSPESGKIYAMWDDLRWDGLERIKILAEVKEGVSRDVIRAMEESLPEHMLRRNEEGLRKYGELFQQQRKEAWETLQRIRSEAP